MTSAAPLIARAKAAKTYILSAVVWFGHYDDQSDLGTAGYVMLFADQKMKKKRVHRPPTDLQLESKARQAAKVEEIRRALIVAGYRTTAEQAFVLGVNRSTAWALLNRDKRAGPSAIVLKRILSSQNLPQAVRRKVEEYIKEKSAGRYAHDKRRVRWFCDQFRTITSGDNEAAGYTSLRAAHGRA